MTVAVRTFNRRVEYRFSDLSATIPDYVTRAKRNSARNRKRSWPLAEIVSNNGTAVLVGSGPSLNVDEVRACNGDVFAIGKTAATKLNAAGIRPDFAIFTNPQSDARLPPARRYLLADHCDPALFDRTKDIRTFSCPIGPAGATAITGVMALGYRHVHAHGFDSSYPDGPIEVECDGRKFRTSVWLASQVDSITQSAARLLNLQGSLTVHGEGLLPTALAAIQKLDDGPADEAEMDFSNNPINFDFGTWLAAAELHRRRSGCDGPLRVRLHGFDATRQDMIDNVVRPIVHLFGAVEDSTVRSNRLHHFSYKVFTEAFRRGETVPKIYVPSNKVTASGTPENRITITLRETNYAVERNSDIAAWLDFGRRRRAEGYTVIFVRDTSQADAPLADFETCPAASRNLLDRMALYNASLCNLSRDNGPPALMFFSDIPFLMFTPLHQTLKDGWHGPQHESWWTNSVGITPPEQLPWVGKMQRIEWLKDTSENLEAGWQRWLAVKNG